MDIQQNYPLAELTTFHIGGPAKYYVKVGNLDELCEALRFAKKENLAVLILGGGSNVLISDEGFNGLVIGFDFKGIGIVNEDGNSVEIKVGSGEIWDKVVEFAVGKGLWGIENLSFIPGKTGAVPVQNIGAYGQEAAQTVAKVEAYEIKTGQLKTILGSDCGFGYRKSNFNSIWKGEFVLLYVYFSLRKNGRPNISYIDVKNYFSDLKIEKPGLDQVRQAIIEIRKAKFPNDITKIGNAGSFFKNLILTQEQYDLLKSNVKKNFGADTAERLEQIRNKFPQEKGIKIPTAFLVDICGLKGQSFGHARLWEKQSLVIVNEGNATARDVLGLFCKVKQVIFEKTGMIVDHEPEFVGFSKAQLEEIFKLN